MFISRSKLKFYSKIKKIHIQINISPFFLGQKSSSAADFFNSNKSFHFRTNRLQNLRQLTINYWLKINHFKLVMYRLVYNHKMQRMTIFLKDSYTSENFYIFTHLGLGLKFNTSEFANWGLPVSGVQWHNQ